MNAIHPQTSETQETLDPRIPAAGPANTDTHVEPEPGLDDRPQARLYRRERESVPTVAGDPAVVAAKEAQEAAAAFNAIGATADETSPEFVAADKRTTEADAAFADAPVTSTAGALAKMQELKALVISPALDADEKGLDARHLETVVTFLEGGLAGADPDPAVVAFAQFMEAKAAEEAFPDDVAVKEPPEYLAAGDRRYAAGCAVYDAVPTTLAGVGVKVRFLVDHEERGNDLWTPFDCMAKSMLPFLEGGAAAAPPAGAGCDPVVALYMKLGAISDEAIAIYEIDPARTEPETENLWYAALDRRDAVLDQIEETPARSTEGVAIKTQLASHYGIKAADAEDQTLTEKEREFLIAYRRLSRAQAQAMRELLRDVHNGVGPDRADMEAWVDNRVAEIKARSAPVAP